jgi:flavin reductase (DIM6/NTAB) family NADH-FMN oxidoreductase RutF
VRDRNITVRVAGVALGRAEHSGSRTLRLIEASGRFSVSILRDVQLDAAMKAGHGASGDDNFAALGIGILTRIAN